MLPGPSLGELQRWMRWVITHPAGVTRAMLGVGLPALPPRFEEPSPRLLPLVRGEPGTLTSPEARLSIYANGYFSRLHEALQADFPGLEEAIGPDRFRELVAVHLLAHPSTSPSLADLGEGLPETLAGLPAGAELPWTVDLARLERTVAELWLTKSGPAVVLRPSETIDWAAVRLKLAPTLRLLETAWTVDLWRESRAPLRREVRRLAVWRQEATNVIEPLGLDSWATLQALAAGRTLDEACAVAEAHGTSPSLLLAAFARWVQRGWIAQVVPPSA